MAIDALYFLSGLVVAFVIGTASEYVVHRLMHKRIVLGQVHVEHHKEGYGQGWLKEFKDYAIPALPFVIGIGLFDWLVLDSIPLAIGTAVGGLGYAVFAAYAHQLQHEHPEQAFWMRRPVHYIHHTHKMWHHNFGISFDIWDRLCGTYQWVEWKPEQPRQFKKFFSIKWI